ncbi:MAG: glycerol-3-phosphate responsive antiterminator [Eubacteriales bacterium]|jgi:glycerol uptake operon antiterminator|nr:glycerol-3-phosphate responsive antiterminator [Eubacteriales bacterium]
MGRDFVNKIEASPIIAAVKNDSELERCLKTEVEVVFTLYGDVCTIPEITKKIKAAGRIAMVHLDLVAGLTQKEISIDYIRDRTCADGIITTRANLIRHAKERGLATVLRYFVLDSMAIDNIHKLALQRYSSQPDVIEILPGTLVPKVVKRICAMSRVPVVAGGLIQDREDVMNMLDNGVIAISTSCPDVWLM